MRASRAAAAIARVSSLSVADDRCPFVEKQHCRDAQPHSHTEALPPDPAHTRRTLLRRLRNVRVLGIDVGDQRDSIRVLAHPLAAGLFMPRATAK